MTTMLTAAAQNREAQKDLFADLDPFIESVGYDQVAERLGIEVEDLMLMLDGQRDVTMTELRLIAIAAEVTITYSVTATLEQNPGLLGEISDLFAKDGTRVAA
jgi:hypothetical protein